MIKNKKFNYYIALLAVINTIALCFFIVTKKEGDNLMLAVSLGDTKALMHQIELNKNININYKNINQSNTDSPISLAMKLGNPDIIKILIKNKANLSSKDEHNKTAIDYLFSDNSVNTIKYVIPYIEKDLYDKELYKYISYGLKQEVKVKHSQRKSEYLLERVNRLSSVSRYIVNELASQDNIKAAIFSVCSGVKIQYKKEPSYEPLEYLLPFLENNNLDVSSCKNLKPVH